MLRFTVCFDTKIGSFLTVMPDWLWFVVCLCQKSLFAAWFEEGILIIDQMMTSSNLARWSNFSIALLTLEFFDQRKFMGRWVLGISIFILIFILRVLFPFKKVDWPGRDEVLGWKKTYFFVGWLNKKMRAEFFILSLVIVDSKGLN